MKVNKKLKKIIKYILTGLLTLGVVISLGLLSFTGMLLLSPVLLCAILAFLLAGVFEGQVYKENILLGLEQLELLGKKGVNILLVKTLDDLAANPAYSTCAFAQEYLAQKNLVASFKGKKLTPEQKEEKKVAKEQLRTMQKFFVSQVLLPMENEPEQQSDDDLSQLIQAAKLQLPAIQNKIRLLRASFLLTTPASIGSGFVTASALKATLLVLGIKFAFVLSATALSGLLWPLVVIAAIGYIFLIYHSIADMICNETLKNKWQSFKKWFIKREDESRVRQVLRITGAVILTTLVIGLAIFATLATAGTWWFAAKKGILLLPHLTRAAVYIRDVIIPAAGFTQLIFNVKNSLATVKALVTQGKLPKPIQTLKESFNDCRKKENWGQILNPFRIITKIVFTPIKLALFLGHLTATGLTSDNVPKVNSIITTTVNAAAEGFEDATYIFTGDTENDHHDHGNLVEWGLKLALSPLFLLSATWNWGLSQLNDGEKKKKLGFLEAVKQSFGVEEKPEYKPADKQADQGSDTAAKWQKIKHERKIDKEIKRLDRSFFNTVLAQEKIKILTELKNPEQSLNSQQKKTLSKHRFGFFGIPRSAELAETITIWNSKTYKLI